MVFVYRVILLKPFLKSGWDGGPRSAPQRRKPTVSAAQRRRASRSSRLTTGLPRTCSHSAVWVGVAPCAVRWSTCANAPAVTVRPKRSRRTVAAPLFRARQVHAQLRDLTLLALD
jgi:hypothetical protein